ncbi:MAG: M15 family metallopeptidase [Sandaracinaceae bacterium]|nr:M15 family metallopeptidase [Sandaracinaceae bacterium]
MSSLRSPRAFVLVAALLGGGGCDGQLRTNDGGLTADDAPIDPRSDAGPPRDAFMAGDAAMPSCFEPPFGTSASGLTIDEAVAGGGCSAAIVRPLAEQLIEELDCLEPGTMARIDGTPGLDLSSTAPPRPQTPAPAALAEAIPDGPGTLTVNSTLRTLPQQLMLYRWYVAGLCGITLAASPGTSPHESGLAIDTSEYSAWQSALEAHGWRWHGAGDLVHFDYVAGGVSLPGLSVRAFQRLWNRNHPEDLIDEDGIYGPQTESRLRMSPAEGFPIGAICHEVDRNFALRWEVGAEGYTLRAEPPMGTESVAYRIDGRDVGEGVRADGFARLVGGCADGMGHRIDAVAHDTMGAELAARTAYVEARASDAMFVQPRAGATFEIGLERPSAAVVAIEVDADGTPLADEVSGETRSTRRAITRTFTTLGTRHLTLRAYDDAGSVIVMDEADVELVATP